MAVTLATIITDVDALMPNLYTDANKIGWVNEIENDIYTDVVTELSETKIKLTKNVDSYTMSGFTYDDIKTLYNKITHYKPRTLKDYRKNGYYLKDGKLAFYPTPTADDTVYTSTGGGLTFATTTVTTLNTSNLFTDFNASDEVTLSGSTDNTANNLTASITQISTDYTVLSFPDGTFSAQVAEGGTVSIEDRSVRVVYRTLPTAKTATTDTITLPDNFKPLYEYYLYSKICIFNEEFAKANNYINLYNQEKRKVRTWWNRSKDVSITPQNSNY